MAEVQSGDPGESVNVDPRFQSRFFMNSYRTLINSEILGKPERTISSENSEPTKASNTGQARDISESDLLIIADYVKERRLT